MRIGAEVYHSLKTKLKEASLSSSIGDEGGFAPSLSTSREALDLIVSAIEGANYEPGEDVVIALDVAATALYADGKYHFKGERKTFSADDLIAYYDAMIADYPIVSLEDGMSEEDWEGWKSMTDSIGNSVQLVGDDIFVTNPKRISRGITEGVANAVLIKPNQIGTLTETLRAIEMTHKAGMRAIISHRSGETEDTSIADIAVALNTGQIKTGAPARSDRVAKYNRLLRIEEELGTCAKFPGEDIFA
jgi:enolase